MNRMLKKDHSDDKGTVMKKTADSLQSGRTTLHSRIRK